MKNIVYILFTMMIIISACSKKNESIAKEEGEETALQTDFQSFTDEQIKLAGIETGQIKEIEIGSSISCSGIVNVQPNGIARIYAPINGNMSSILVQMADKVQKGQTIAIIKHQGIISLQEEFLKAKANLHLQTQLFERDKKLLAENASSAKQNEMIQKDYSDALIIYNSLKNQIELIGINHNELTETTMSAQILIKSPVSGYISSIMTGIGTYISADEMIAEIIDESKKNIELEIFSNNRSFIEIGQKVLIKPLGDKNIIETKIDIIGKSLNTEKQTLTAISNLNVAYPNLIPGAAVNAEIIAKAKPVYALPTEAIADIEGAYYVFSRQNNNFSRHQVNIGIKNDQYTEILNYNELLQKEIVIKGVYYLTE